MWAELYVEVPGQGTIEIPINFPFYSIADVKSMIAEATNPSISVERQQLYYQSQLLSDNSDLMAYNIMGDGETLQLNILIGPSERPLTFEAVVAGAQVSYTIASGTLPPVEYCTDESTWTAYSEPITLANVGDKVFFRGNNSFYGGAKFQCTNDCYIYGNIMSLVNAENFASATTLTGENTFSEMLQGNTHITNHPSKELVLPATTLTAGCYSSMFSGCTGLTSAPELPATTLAARCYAAMFSGCTGLTSTPALLATTLTEECYQEMFSGCTGLSSVVCSATGRTNTNATTNWLSGVAQSGTFYAPEGSVFASDARGVSSIPTGWNIITNTFVPLTFEAMEAGAEVSFSGSAVEYSINDGEWVSYSSAISLANVGDKVSFRGNNASYSWKQFSCSADCYIYGNIMSLVDATGYPGATKLTKSNTFAHLFQNNTHIANHPSKNLVLPATTLTEYCYSYMFSDCSGLTRAPELPATTLAAHCYDEMFNSCTGITSAPILPATTLAEYCYVGMFWECTGLTSAPELPATTLARGCYNWMFRGCTGLTSAPELPATDLVEACYINMFRGCSNLSSVTCLATSRTDNGVTGSWLSGVAESGTFYAPTNGVLASDDRGANGIPTGWNIDIPRASVTSAPTAKTGLVYTGSAQTLVSAGTARGGTMQYSLDNSNWSADLPAATEVGEYTVYYKVVGDDNHLDSESGSIQVTIKPFVGEGTAEEPYLISSTADWDFLADQVNAGTTYAGKYFRQTADISVTTMVGTGNHLNTGGSGEDYITFNGIYDGDGNTLTVNIDVVGGERYGAPFHCVSNATIKNLIVTGYVSTDGGRHPSGLIGCSPSGNILIENCRVSTNVSGTDYMGGLVGHGMYANITIRGCVYSGTLTATGTEYTGGFIGWCDGSTNKTFDISNCLFAGSYSGSGNFHPIGINYHKNGHNNTRNIANTYYTALSNMSDDHSYSFANGLSYKGKQARTITTADGLTVANAGDSTIYNVSGITSYGVGIKFNGVLYGGEGDEVSLNLGGAEVGYKVSAGTLSGDDNPYALTMADANAQISQALEGSGTEEDPYLIASAEDWNSLADKVNAGSNYAGKFFRQTADISVSTMIGDRIDDSNLKPFSGSYDGAGHTLTLDITTTSASTTAPFRFIQGAIIRNLHTAGTITTSRKFAGGIVGRAICGNTIINCQSDVAITSTINGDGTHGGLIGIEWGSCGETTLIEGCVFNGQLLGESTNCCGGFVGWCEAEDKLTIRNSLYLPQANTLNPDYCQTFTRAGNMSGISISNCYYSQAFGGAQGKQMRSITAGDFATVANAGDATVYDVSGITSYGVGIKYGDVLYAGEGDEVSLNLTHADIPVGHSFSQYGSSTGSLTGEGNPYTLTMANANAEIDAHYSINQYTITVEGGSGGGTYDYGTEVTLTATPADNYHFTEWSDHITTASRDVMVTENATYTALSEEDAKTTVYLVPGVWAADDAQFAAHVFEDGKAAAWSAIMTPTDDGRAYQAEVYDYAKIIFVRLKNTATTANWDDKWNQTDNLTRSSDNCYQITGWGGADGRWRNYPFYYVQFIDFDDTVLKTDTVDGGNAAAAPADPSRTGYTFTGWDAEYDNITSDLTITAQYEINKYTVVWKNEDGTTLETDENVEYGSTPSFDGETPTKAATAQYTYTFDKWSPAIETVTGNATYTAQYAATPKSYALAWNAAGGELSGEYTDGETAFGTTIVAPTATRTGYTFDSWTPEVPATMPAADATYTATWTEIKHDVVVEAGTNGQVSVAKVENIGIATVSGDIAATPNTGYHFVNWTLPDGVTLAEGYALTDATIQINATADDKTITANFAVTAYTLTWVLDGGEVKTAGTEAGSVNYGTELTAPVVEKTGYTFTGWSPAVPETMPAEDVEFTAQWEINKYTVTIVNDSVGYGVVDVTSIEAVPYGTLFVIEEETPNVLYVGAIEMITATPAESTSKYKYEFKAWADVPAYVESDVTIHVGFTRTDLSPATSINDVQGDKVQCTKILRGQHIYIIRSGETYDLTGQRVQ
ncbi:MAG: InlB B-repeat-containing protein [Paludibacteraceae bacterium]|nr:InlB B-repeat-containing protein [Paludibacteraceae bacterium]